MGLFRKKPKDEISFEIETKISHGYISKRDTARLQNGWKMDVNGSVHAPDTVWISGPRAKVFHCRDICRGAIISNEPVPMKRTRAEKMGLCPCSKCDWDYNPWI